MPHPLDPRAKRKPKNPWSAAFLGWHSRGRLSDKPQALYANRKIKPAISDAQIQRIRREIASGR